MSAREYSALPHKIDSTIILLLITFFFFNYTATTEIYTLSLHDALPISRRRSPKCVGPRPRRRPGRTPTCRPPRDRKSTRLNFSHRTISYAVFCLKKKNVLSEAEHDVPYTNGEVSLYRGKVLEAPRALADERCCVVIERQSQVDQGRRDRPAVHQPLFLDEVPSPRPH